MRLIALLLIFPLSAVAGPCEKDAIEDDRPLTNAFHQLQYSAIIKPGGVKLKVGGIDYVIAGAPFRDFASGKRYVIYFPARLNDGSGYYDLETYHDKGPPCSDMKIIGENNPTHSLPINERRYVSSSFYEDRSRYQVHRSLYTYMAFKVGGTRGEIRLHVEDNEIPRVELDRPEYDISDDMNWSELGHSSPMFSQLRALMNHVYIQPLD